MPLGADISDSEALDRIQRMLDRQRKPVGSRTQNDLSFEAPLWHDLAGPNWLAMVIYDSGLFGVEVTAKGRRLYYDLRSLHAFVFCICVSPLFAGFNFLTRDVNGAVPEALFAFAWLYGVNMLLAWVRIPRTIKRAVAGYDCN